MGETRRKFDKDFREGAVGLGCGRAALTGERKVTVSQPLAGQP